MTERRQFSDGERVALFLAADGRCQCPGCPACRAGGCRIELEPGWHADHVDPYSRSRNTDVTNGQALCPPCNLAKGSKLTALRVWQDEALARLLRNTDDFLAVATPGAGKTTFALTAVQRLIEREEIQRVVVVVPSTHLRRQWSRAAAKLGVQLDYKFANRITVISADMDGVVVTYSTVAAQKQLWRKLCSDRRTLVILDEIHHCDDDDKSTWGPAIKSAFEVATRRIMLSGTPFRTNGKPIPFVQYDELGRCVPDYNYDYGTALMDGGVVRPIEFPALDGDMAWRTAGQVMRSTLSQVDPKEAHHAMVAAYDADGSWIHSVLSKADQELSRHREAVPDAGGLVLAPDQTAAKRYAAILEQITKERPVLAITDEADSSDQIEKFAESSDRWMVAVQMVSEGVDIPRLEVGVYTSRVKTSLFFRQVVGRFVRMRGSDDEACATLFIPSIQVWLGYAEEIERTVDQVLRETREEMKKRESNPGTSVDLVESLSSSDASLFATVHGGEAFPDAELRRAESLAQLAGLERNVTAAQAARLLRLGGAGRVLGTVTVPPPAVPLVDTKHAMRRLIKVKVGKLAYRRNVPHENIHADLNRECRDKAATATVETLNKRLEMLDKWLDQE